MTTYGMNVMSDVFRPTTPEQVREFLKTPMRSWLCTTKEWKKQGVWGDAERYRSSIEYSPHLWELRALRS